MAERRITRHRGGSIARALLVALALLTLAAGSLAAAAAAVRPHAHHHARRCARRHHRSCRRRPAGRGGGDQIVDLPVSFTVQNVNRSKASCPSDGATYVIKGHIVAPRSALHAASPAVTLYLHGSIVGEPVWTGSLAPYNWVLEQAKAGHATVTIDQLGFGASGIPNGIQLCVGSWADTAHQVIGELRSGHYTVSGSAPIRFRRVALASYCLGGLIAQVEAYSFHDIDAFVMISSAFDQGFSPGAGSDLVTNPNGPTIPCLHGGDPKRPGAAGGYAYVFKGTERRYWLYNTDPSMVDAVVAAHEREPCAEGTSLGPALSADRLFLGQITVPVLLVFGNQDAIFPPPDGQRQAALFTGSHDVTLVQIDQAGHALQLGRTAPVAGAAVSGWLRAHRF